MVLNNEACYGVCNMLHCATRLYTLQTVDWFLSAGIKTVPGPY